MIYTGRTLEAAMADLDGITVAALGDSITYKAAGGAYVPLRAFVDYRDALRDIGTGNVIEQDITVQMLISDAPVKPGPACRLTLPLIAGKIFKPVNVRRTESGTFWEFEVSSVNA